MHYIEGSLASDSPDRIISHLVVDESNVKKKLFFQVKWKRRKDGFEPNPTFLDLKILKSKCPRLVLSYLEQFIVLG
jgi:hypothetical protein